MAMRSVRRLASISLSIMIAACADGSPPSGPRVRVEVAPLALGNVEEVCYGLTVFNGDPSVAATQTVWTQSNLCSGQYGNGPGGDISYVGPCDVQAGQNYVRLVLNTIEVPDGLGSLSAAGGTDNILDDQLTVSLSGDGDPDFVNPCTSTQCTLNFACIENSDVPVVFNLTVMRDADQGFFDVAVNFDDIFCSAKVDTCYPAGPAGPVGDRAIELLFGKNADGDLVRGHTAVLAMACTGGPNDDDGTHLYMSDILIDCGGVQTWIDPIVGPGNAYSPPGSLSSGQVWQYAVYEGREELDCGSLPCDKNYWSVAIGIEGLPPGCKLSAAATAADHALPGGVTPANTAYPVIDFGPIDLTDGSGVICSQNPLGSAHVTTRYTDFGPGETFRNVLKRLGDGVSTDRAVQTCVAVADGPADAPSTWTSCAGGVPGPTDSASIPTDIGVWLTSDFTVTDLLVQGSLYGAFSVTTAGTFQVGAGGSVDVTAVNTRQLDLQCSGSNGTAGGEATADVAGTDGIAGGDAATISFYLAGDLAVSGSLAAMSAGGAGGDGGDGTGDAAGGVVFGGEGGRGGDGCNIDIQVAGDLTIGGTLNMLGSGGSAGAGGSGLGGDGGSGGAGHGGDSGAGGAAGWIWLQVGGDLAVVGQATVQLVAGAGGRGGDGTVGAMGGADGFGGDGGIGGGSAGALVQASNVSAAGFGVAALSGGGGAGGHGAAGGDGGGGGGIGSVGGESVSIMVAAELSTTDAFSVTLRAGNGGAGNTGDGGAGGVVNTAFFAFDSAAVGSVSLQGTAGHAGGGGIGGGVGGYGGNIGSVDGDSISFTVDGELTVSGAFGAVFQAGHGATGSNGDGGTGGSVSAASFSFDSAMVGSVSLQGTAGNAGGGGTGGGDGGYGGDVGSGDGDSISFTVDGELTVSGAFGAVFRAGHGATGSNGDGGSGGSVSSASFSFDSASVDSVSLQGYAGNAGSGGSGGGDGGSGGNFGSAGGDSLDFFVGTGLTVSGAFSAEFYAGNAGAGSVGDGGTGGSVSTASFSFDSASVDSVSLQGNAGNGGAGGTGGGDGGSGGSLGSAGGDSLDFFVGTGLTVSGAFSAGFYGGNAGAGSVGDGGTGGSVNTASFSFDSASMGSVSLQGNAGNAGSGGSGGGDGGSGGNLGSAGGDSLDFFVGTGLTVSGAFNAAFQGGNGGAASLGDGGTGGSANTASFTLADAIVGSVSFAGDAGNAGSGGVQGDGGAGGGVNTVVEAVSLAVDDFDAACSAGNGGAGGVGDGVNGGDGTAGGSAQFTLTVSTSFAADAASVSATGGNGGRGGDAHNAGQGGMGGAGGDAAASVTAQSLNIPASNVAANGGNHGLGGTADTGGIAGEGGNGGNASASLSPP